MFGPALCRVERGGRRDLFVKLCPPFGDVGNGRRQRINRKQLGGGRPGRLEDVAIAAHKALALHERAEGDVVEVRVSGFGIVVIPDDLIFPAGEDDVGGDFFHRCGPPGIECDLYRQGLC